MTNEEILTKAIEKAVKNGYPAEFHENDLITLPLGDTRLTCNLAGWDEGNESYHIIFDHRFAKALFGEERFYHFTRDGRWMVDHPRDGLINLPSWQFHLQRMVLEEDPIKYLEKFI